jgi:cupin fold WbuC family metalloprotein
MRDFSFTEINNIFSGVKEKHHNRSHFNLHMSHNDNCQKLLLKLHRGTFIKPHRHIHDLDSEILICLQGRCRVVLFHDDGRIHKSLVIDTNHTPFVEIYNHEWHTVLPISQEAILFEVKSGPFREEYSKEFPVWFKDAKNPQQNLQNLMSELLKSGEIDKLD